MVQNLRHSENVYFVKTLRNNVELFEMIQNGNCILVTGPHIVTYTRQEESKQHFSYLLHILHGMIDWCSDKNIITDPEVIEDFRRFVRKRALLPLTYKIEEYLSDKREQHLCIKEVVLQNQALTQDFYQFLIKYSFRGYITTTYDTFIEEAYQAKEQHELTRFYINSVQDAMIACRTKQPFILKLYGDVENVGSIGLSRQVTKGLTNVKDLHLLQQIGNNLPLLFLGFDQTETDLNILKEIFGKREWIFCPLSFITKLDRDHIPLKIDLSIQSDIPGKSNGNPSTTTETKRKVFASKGEQANEQPQPSSGTIKIFLSFVTKDKACKTRLEVYLNVLKRQYKRKHNLNIEIIHKDNIGAGHEWKVEIEQFLANAHIILLLVSIDFLDSAFCAEVEMARAIERHLAKEARVIPIILDSCAWDNEVFCNLKPLPEEGKAIDKWGKKDQAFANISSGIEQSIKELMGYL